MRQMCPIPPATSTSSIPARQSIVGGGRLLRLADVEAKVSLGRSTIYRQIKAGLFPAPLVVSAGSVRWLEAEIDGWIDGLSKSQS